MPSTTPLFAKFISRRQTPDTPAIPGLFVIKRDGAEVPWDASKITRAVALAFYDVRRHGAPCAFFVAHSLRGFRHEGAR